MPLSNDQLRSLQHRLMTRKLELEKRLAASEQFGLENEWMKESTGELSNYDNHPADQGTELFERGKDLALNEHANRELAEIELALEKIYDGTYGICEECGMEISFERLEAHPTALRCLEHSRDQTAALQRPIEERVMEPPFAEFVHEDDNKALFNADDSWQQVAKWGTSETPSDFLSHETSNYNEMYLDTSERIGAIENIESFLASKERETYDGENEIDSRG